MKVLYLVNDLPSGGLERQLALLATNLPDGWRPRVLAMGGGPFEDYLRERGIPVIVARRRSRFDPLPAASLWRELLTSRPDVVHSWGWMPALAAGPLCRLLGIACIDGMIRSGMLEPDFTLLKRLGMASATLVVANSKAGLRAWNVAPAKARLVYNGFDRSRLESVPAAARTDPTTFTVIMTGRMTPAKEFACVVDAARRLTRTEDGWRFLLVGDGPDRDHLLRQADDLVRSGVVAFPRPGLEVLGLVRQADVGVLMTDPALLSEGFSNSIMEYMAVGLPVVCSSGGGNSELVQDGVTGYVIPPSDARTLADRLEALRRDRATGAAMGALGRETILTEHSVETMVATMLHIYAEAFESVRAARAGRRLARRPWVGPSR